MKKIILFLVFVFTTSICLAQPAYRLVDEDGHELDINSDGTISLADDSVDTAALKDTDTPADEECATYEETGDTIEWQACGAGGGDNATVNSTAVDTTADFLDNVIIEFDITDGGAGGPDSVTGTLATDSVGHTALADTDSPADEECYTYEATGNTGEWQACGGGGGATEVILGVHSAMITGSLVTMTPAGCSTTASTQGAQIGGGDGNWRLLFDDTTDEAAIWQFKMPSSYSSDPILDVGFSAASATSAEVEFEAAIACITPGTDNVTMNQNNFANCAIGTATTVASLAGRPYEQSITLTDDSCAADDVVIIWLSTDADDGTNDDATGDREVIYVTLSYTGS